MKKLQINSDQEVKNVFKNYPDTVREKLFLLRNIIIDTAREINEIESLEETLKWGEPSYLTKNGSTVRIDWKEKKPDQYAVYFKCTSLLVPTFEKVFGDTFSYEGTRAIVFQMNDTVPVTELKRCIRAALTYHHVKKLDDLGI